MQRSISLSKVFDSCLSPVTRVPLSQHIAYVLFIGSVRPEFVVAKVVTEDMLRNLSRPGRRPEHPDW